MSNFEFNLDNMIAIKPEDSSDKQVMTLYNMRNNLRETFKDVYLKSILNGTPFWGIPNNLNVVVDTKTNQFYILELTVEQLLSLGGTLQTSDFNEGMLAIDDVKLIINGGLTGLMKKYRCKDLNEFINHIFINELASETKDIVYWLAKEDEEVAKTQIVSIINEMKQKVKQVKELKEYYELTRIIRAICKMSTYLAKVDFNYIKETEQYVRNLVQELLELDELNEMIYVTNALCLYLQEVDLVLEVKDSKYSDYCDIIPDEY